MAFNSNIKGYMTFGKSFSRGAAFPLEAYEIWTDYDALVAYAANTDPNKDPSYIGQKVAYVDLENNKVTHYGIEIDGTLKELGASPIGDEKSIVIGENNTISLKGIETLVFERDIIGEDDQPTGQKENVQFQPLMTKDGLIWVEPSKTTVEGLASLIDGLTARVSALENDRVTEEELAAAVKAEADRAKAAEEALDATIKAIDFVDNDELANAIKDFATKNELADAIKDFATDSELAAAVKEEADRAKGVEEELRGAIATIDFIDEDELDAAVEAGVELAKSYTDEEIGKIEQAIANLNHFTAKVVTDKSEMTEAGVLYLFKVENATGSDVYEEYIVVDGVATLIGDTTTDLSNYYNKTDIDGKVETLEGAIEDEAEARAALAEEVAALKAVDNATQAELDEYKQEVTAALNGKVGTDVFGEFQTANTQAIATAKQEAIDAAALAVTNAAYATKAELEAHEEAADGKYATKDEVETAFDGVYTKTEVDNKIGTPGVPAVTDEEGNEVTPAVQGTGVFANAYSRAEIDKLLDEVQGGSSASADSVLRQLNTYKSTNDERVGNIETKNGEQDTAIAAAQAKADAVGTALQTLENGTVVQNTNKIGAIDTRLAGVETTVGTHTTNIAELTGKVNALVGEDAAINEAISKLNGDLTTESGTRASEITRVEGLISAVNTKADNINTKLGEVPSDKTVVDLINDAKDAATYDDTAVKKLISDEAARADAEEKRIVGLVEAEATTARAAEQANAKKINEIDATLKAAIENDGAGLDSIKELAVWIEEHETEVIPQIEANTNAIAALTDKVDTGDKTVATYVADAIAAIPVATATIAGLVKASGEVTVAEDGTLGIGQVSTDKLVQGNLTLILNGGDAEVSAN